MPFHLKELTDTPVHGWPRIAMYATAPSFGSKVDIHGEEDDRLIGKRLSDNFPLRNQRLPARCPRLVCRIDTSRVVLQRWARKHFIGIKSTTWVWLVKADKVWFVEVGDADVTT